MWLQNLLAATDIGTLFLDSGLRIKRFTDQVAEPSRIAAQDEGRPITDFANLLEYDGLVKDAQAVLAHLTPIRREVRGRNDQWYDIRIRPYRTVDDKIDGVVITFVNISERRQVEEALRASEQSLRRQKSLVDRAREPIFIWDYDTGILDWNRGCEELYGFSREEALGKRPERLLSTTPEGSSFAEIREILLREGSWRGEVRQRTKDRRAVTVECRIYLETIAGQRLAMEGARDISERKQWEGRQQLLLDELAHRVKNTLAVVQSIAQQTLRGRGTAKEMVGKLEGRIMALARSHSQLVSSEWKGADFRALAKQQLEPYGADSSRRIHLKGDAVSLPADLATPFGLVLHELATNAAKHGSLSRPKGSVHLAWSIAARNSGPVLTVVWEEKGGPPPKAQKRMGFGTALIDRGIPRAKVKREMKPKGLVCTIEFPLSGQPKGKRDPEPKRPETDRR